MSETVTIQMLVDGDACNMACPWLGRMMLEHGRFGCALFGGPLEQVWVTSPHGEVLVLRAEGCLRASVRDEASDAPDAAPGGDGA